VRGADGFAPGIGAAGVDVFILGEVQDFHCNGEKRVLQPRGRDDARGHRSAGLKTAATSAKSGPPPFQAQGKRKAGATGHRALALTGLKTRHYSGEKQVPLERLVDMEVSRKKD